MANAKFELGTWRSILMSALALSVFFVFSSALYADGVDSNNKPVTFSKDIAPIFQAKCQECHHAGTPAPMSLITYQDTRPWLRAIRLRVSKREMPPWHLDKTVGILKVSGPFPGAPAFPRVIKTLPSGLNLKT